MPKVLVAALALSAYAPPLETASQESAPPAELTQHHVEGRTLVRAIQFESEYELLTSSSLMNGKEPPAAFSPKMNKSGSQSADLQFADTITSLKDGAIGAFERAYGDNTFASAFHQSFDGPLAVDPIEQESEVASPLEGETVTFARSEGELTAVPDPKLLLEEGDLERLPIDVSLAFLLPEDADADEWDVDPSYIDALTQTDTFLTRPRGESAHGVISARHKKMAAPAAYGGAIFAKRSGHRDVNGRTMQVIALEVECTSKMSFALQVTKMSRRGDDGEEGEHSELLDQTFEGKGEALWDVEGGFFAAVTLDLQFERKTSTKMDVSDPRMGGEMLIEQIETHEGTIELRYRCSVQ